MPNKFINLFLLSAFTYLGLAPLPVQAKPSLLNENHPTTIAQDPTSICPAQLGPAINAIVNRSQFRRAHWGILVETLSNGLVLYQHNQKAYFIPASNAKILTTASALAKLGSQYQIRTSIYGSSDGTLSVVGRGDPSLTDSSLTNLAEQLKQKGITQIKELVAEDGYFTGNLVNPTWEWEDIQSGDGAPVNSLIVNQNTIGLTLSPQGIGQPLQVNWADPTEGTGWKIDNKSVTVSTNETEFVDISRDFDQNLIRVNGQLHVGSEPDTASIAVSKPTEHFLQRFQKILTTAGINVGKIKIGSSKGHENEQELAAIDSPPLAKLLMDTNLPSNNFYAETLLRLLGATTNQSSQDTDTSTKGLEVIRDTLTKLGVDPDSYVQADGSGLSRHNLVSPEALVQILRAMVNIPAASVWKASLPVAGVSGTLMNRFRNTPAQNIVSAKTGTLQGIVSLSGYINAPEQEPLVFSMIINQSAANAATLRQPIDEIVILLTSLRRC